MRDNQLKQSTKNPYKTENDENESNPISRQPSPGPPVPPPLPGLRRDCHAPGKSHLPWLHEKIVLGAQADLQKMRKGGHKRCH